ncbi:hypothetical protein CYMTET_35268 [Cymbomonas tetramitiformis]|uniref:Uncharacterized protein n=1 Tax=Cymbomonas tetramitiformis TaxID=36881 RepID=A0AAE0F9J6_9CHLO|nr:hypothetical protein CYMTET_35268 [Cymbomonas tetramitiformis]
MGLERQTNPFLFPERRDVQLATALKKKLVQEDSGDLVLMSILEHAENGNMSDEQSFLAIRLLKDAGLHTPKKIRMSRERRKSDPGFMASGAATDRSTDDASKPPKSPRY